MIMRTWRMSLGTLGVTVLPVIVSAILCSSPFFAIGTAQQSQPTTSGLVRTTTNLVQISVIAADKKNQPVEDLTSDDFVILDNGHPQNIAIFRKERSQLPAQASAALPPDTYTNKLSESGRVPSSVTMVLLDGLNTAPSDQAAARQQIIKFLQQIKPQDRLAIFTLARDLRVLQPLTSDSTKLVAAVKQYSGRNTMDLDASTPTQLQTGDSTMDALLQDAFQRESIMYIQDRVRITVDALIAIANSTTTLPGRKNLLWISGSFPFSVGYEDLSNLAQVMNDPKREVNLSGEQQMYAEDIERAAQALNEANIAVYPVDARGLISPNMNTTKSNSKNPGFGAMNSGSQCGALPGSGGGHSGGRGSSSGSRFPGSRPLRTPGGNSSTGNPANPIANPDHTTFETMDALAEGTGGKAFYNTNDISSSLQAAMGDSRMTYEIGYYPSDVKWDGSFHTVTVQVKKPEVVVRSRKGYFALPATASNQEAVRAIVANALASPLDATGLNLAVRMKADEHGAGTTSAMLFFDPRAIQVQPKDGTFAGTVDIVLAQISEKLDVLHADQQSIPLRFDSAQYQQFLKQQVALTQPVTLLPNARMLRVVICDGTTGKVGAVTIPLAKYLPPSPPSH